MPWFVEHFDFDSPSPEAGEGRQPPAATVPAREEAVFRAREHLDNWMRPACELTRYRRVPICDSPDGSAEGIFTRDEFALIPLEDLKSVRKDCDRARKALSHIIRELAWALATREVEGE